MSKRTKPKPPTKNGRVLTAKHLRERDYQTVHNAPHGRRADVLHGLLAGLTRFAKTQGKDWVDVIARGQFKIVRH